MSVTVCPPGIRQAASVSAANSGSALLRAARHYWTRALAQHATPIEVGLDVLEWWTTVSRTGTPTWASPNEIVAQWPVARLRDFTRPEEHTGADQVATLFLPPQAGHDSCIVDYSPRQSQVGTARRAGLWRSYSLDWVGATSATKDCSIGDYLAVIAEAIAHVGSPVNLVGDCQGGWLATIYAALNPQDVHTLSIAGAPVDFHAGEPLIQDWMSVFAGGRDIGFYRSLVELNGGVLPGDYQLAGFVAMQPDVELDRQLQLFAHLHDPQHVARYREFETWFKHTQDIPGAFYLWIVEHLFKNNELVKGELVVDGARVRLRDITCPLYLLAGTTDHITPPPQVFALADHAGSAAADVEMRTAAGGHLGLFMGHDALTGHWAQVFETIAGRSAL